ncbi:MAG: tetratricopeptide repeat protein [Pseudomonadota bacterium]
MRNHAPTSRATASSPARFARQSALGLAISVAVVWPVRAEEVHVTSRVHARLVTVQADVEAGDLIRALARAKALLRSTPDKPYDLAMVRQVVAHIHITRGELEPAAPLLRAAIESDALEPSRAQALRRSLGRIQIALGRLQRGVATLERWRKAGGKPNQGDKLALAHGYLQLERYTKAVQILKPLAAKKDAPRAWLEALLAAHHGGGDITASIQVASRLLRREPKKALRWRALARLYEDAKRPRDALSILALGERRGVLTKPREILDIASRYQRAGAPFDAGVLLARGIANGVLVDNATNRQHLATAWIAAHEWAAALDALERIEPAERTPTLSMTMAQLAFQRRDWAQAADYANDAIASGLNVEASGSALVLLGVARHRLGNDSLAANAFAEAARGPSGDAAAAEQWLDHLDALAAANQEPDIRAPETEP